MSEAKDGACLYRLEPQIWRDVMGKLAVVLSQISPGTVGVSPQCVRPSRLAVDGTVISSKAKARYIDFMRSCHK